MARTIIAHTGASPSTYDQFRYFGPPARQKLTQYAVGLGHALRDWIGERQGIYVYGNVDKKADSLFLRQVYEFSNGGIIIGLEGKVRSKDMFGLMANIEVLGDQSLWNPDKNDPPCIANVLVTVLRGVHMNVWSDVLYNPSDFPLVSEGVIQDCAKDLHCYVQARLGGEDEAPPRRVRSGKHKSPQQTSSSF